MFGFKKVVSHFFRYSVRMELRDKWVKGKNWYGTRWTILIKGIRYIFDSNQVFSARFRQQFRRFNKQSQGAAEKMMDTQSEQVIQFKISLRFIFSLIV